LTAGNCRPVTSPFRGVRHILINALGGSAKHVDVDVDLLRVEDGDRLLLCSDGLTDCVTDDTLTTTLGSALPSSEVCQRLLQLALDGGGRDNITAIVATFGSWRKT
jgi:protein phosphatase